MIDNERVERATRPYRRLWASVLLDAVHVVETARSRGWDNRTPTRWHAEVYGCVVSYFDYRETMRWVNSPNEKPASFVWVCELLGHSPEEVRLFLYSLGKSGRRKTRFAA